MEILKLERKKINNINEIYDGTDLLIRDFSNLDLSNIDLSSIPIEAWEDCIFYNTNFKNTGIKFIPNKLRKVSVDKSKESTYPSYYYEQYSYIDYCDFSDNDLTYLQEKDVYVNKYYHIGIYGCNFSNTGINFFKTLINVSLDSSHAEYDYDSDYWHIGTLGFNEPEFIDINTIMKNKFLNVPSFKILIAIKYYIRDICVKNNVTIGSRIESDGRIRFDYSSGEPAYKEAIVKKCEEFLEYDKQGYGKKLYNKLVPFMSLDDKYEFFLLNIKHLNIKNVDFEDIPVEVLRHYEIQKNIFDNVTINSKIEELFKFWGGEHILDIPGYENKYKLVNFPNIHYDSWQVNEGAKKRVSNSAITFFSKVYLELSRDCNAKCPFCRNNSFRKNNYDLEQIKNTLYMIKDYINAVIIGGGEPTLKLNDVKELHKNFLDSRIDWHMFTNGTSKSLINDDYIMDNFKINLSRHAIDDKENCSIFNANLENMMSINDIEKLNARNQQVTLNATCFKGGLDSFEKIIEYISFAKNIGCQKVLIQDLQTDTSLGCRNIKYDNMCIDSSVFEQLLEYLNSYYKSKYPIYATGGYISYLFKDKDQFSVAIQKYISPEELKKGWLSAVIRVSDLSIDPSGNLYENWNQIDGLVKKLKK